MAQAKTPEIWDYVVVGSGFGGSVAALRLAEKGYSVLVLEQGRRWLDQDLPKTNWNLRRFLWAPWFRFFGPFKFAFFRHLWVIHGVGVGGGSLVYANTHLRPGDAFYNAPEWKGLADWKSELAPFYDKAEKMLGVIDWKHVTPADEVLLDVARDLGVENTFAMTRVAVFAGEPGKTVADPYFGGEGPSRTGCTQCGQCMVGCRVGAKNSLVKNYLYLAEKRGVNIRPETRVLDIRPMSDGSYEIISEKSGGVLPLKTKIMSRNIIVSAGCVGTMNLLLKCKYHTRSLSGLSEKLGHVVRTNSEAITGIIERATPDTRDHSRGIAITSHFKPDAVTTVEPVRYGPGSDFIRLLYAPAGDGFTAFSRIVGSIRTVIARPTDLLLFFKYRDLTRHSFMLLVMQHLDNHLSFTLGRSFLTGFRWGAVSVSPEKKKIPAYIPVAADVTRRVGERLNAMPINGVPEILLNTATTAHLIGGAPIGGTSKDGVVNSRHEVHGYPGLYVMDASAIPANLGVNPSLTITAMTERAMSFIPDKSR